jgi:hypothetical protein
MAGRRRRSKRSALQTEHAKSKTMSKSDGKKQPLSHFL